MTNTDNDHAVAPAAAAEAGATHAAAAETAGALSLATRAVAPAPLRDPASALGAELLGVVGASLSVCDRLRSAAVSRAWRSVFAPAFAVHNAHLWRRFDLSADVVPDPDDGQVDAEVKDILGALLARVGPHVREVLLRSWDEDVSREVRDVDVGIIIDLCPNLQLLDVRGSIGVMTWSADIYEFRRFMRMLHARSPPLQQFTLLLAGSGVDVCADCGTRCGGMMGAVIDTFEEVTAWRVKPTPRGQVGGDFCGTDSSHLPLWLQCDLELCPILGDANESDGSDAEDCELFMRCDVQVADAPLPPIDFDSRHPYSYVCDSCGSAVCSVR